MGFYIGRVISNCEVVDIIIIYNEFNRTKIYMQHKIIERSLLSLFQNKILFRKIKKGYCNASLTLLTLDESSSHEEKPPVLPCGQDGVFHPVGPTIVRTAPHQ